MKANQGDYTILLNGKKLKFKDEDPVPRISERGLPVLSTDLLASKMNVQVALVAGEIRMTHADKTVVARIDKIELVVNGEAVRGEGMPYVVAGRMYVPAVQVCNLLGLQAEYDAAGKTLKVQK